MKKVLIVDDQEGIRKLLAEACIILGYDAQTVCTGMEALEILNKYKFQLAIVDMKMPGLSGIETIVQMKTIDEDIKTILMTGYGESFSMEENVNEIANGVVLKPFDLDEIRGLLEALL